MTDALVAYWFFRRFGIPNRVSGLSFSSYICSMPPLISGQLGSGNRATCAYCSVHRRSGYVRLRICQINIETPSQVTVAPMSTNNIRWHGANCQTSRANAKSPMLPIAEPAASMLAAFRSRRTPCCPFLSFFCFSCFSMRVALAGRIAGKAKNRPPMPGPNFLAIIPAPAVISPPKKNRTAYSYHFVCPRTEKSTFTSIVISARRTRAQVRP